MSKVNAIILASFTAMASSSADYTKAAEKIKFVRARGDAETAEVRELCQQALAAKVAEYRKQVHPESGKPAKGSAYQRAVSRMMRDTNPEQGENVRQERKVRVPAALQAAVDKLLATYDKAAMREALKRAA
jgi:uncharacterized protein YdiU (UPF0061 family)